MYRIRIGEIIMKELKLVIVTGLSGAGKTQAMHSLEDFGFFCVDNIPPALIPKFAELCSQTAGEINRVALAVDIRGGEFFADLFGVLEQLDSLGIKYEILFLEASDETLVRRFKESRRRHPLSEHGELLQGIQEERVRLQDLRGKAQRIIDTSNLSIKELKDELNNLFGDITDTSSLLITLTSFGYKYGLPLDSDLVMDVRFLPNPYYDSALRCFTGNDPPIQEYVLKSEATIEFIKKFCELIEFLIPHYIREGKTSLVIAVGCTGGKHRSVALANRIGEILRSKDYRAKVRHRDILQE